MKTIAITGGIASGKSTFSKIIKDRGLPFVDCDALVHLGYEPGHMLYEAVVGHFGTEILDERGLVDRKLLGSKVFNNPEERKLLDQLTHPIIHQMVAEALERYELSGVKLAFVDMPLLFETNMAEDYDASILIDTDECLQLERLMARNSLSEAEALKRMAAQMPLSEKRLRANYLVCNNSTLEVFILHANSLIDQLIKDAESTTKDLTQRA